VSLKSTSTTKPAISLRTQIPQNKAGQETHISSTPWVTSQNVDITLCTLEVVCWLWLGCWSNNAANNHLSPGPFNSKVLYSAPVWCRSACTCLIDPAINNALWTVTGCLHPTQADNLPILAGIQPAELRRIGTTLPLARRAMQPGHLLHSALTCPSSGNTRHLK